MVVDGIDFDEVKEILSVVSDFEEDVLVTGYDDQGQEWEAVGLVSHGVLVEIDEASIDLYRGS